MGMFQALIAKHGTQWTASVPRAAWEKLAEVNEVLSTVDRREALGLKRS